MSALDELNEKQESGLELTSLEFAVWYCTDRVCAENAAAELADYELRLDLLAKEATWEHEENELMKEELSALRAEVEALKWVVKRLEYIEESDEYLLCPICRGEKPTHYEDCELAAALNAPSEGQKRE